MNLAMFFIFLLTDVSIVGIFMFIYAGKEKYSEGMVLGVHIPESEQDHPEVQELGKKYKSSFRKFSFWNFILGVLICFLIFWNMTSFFIIWILWLFAYIIAGTCLIYILHRKMYDIKMKHNWIMGGDTHMLYIDTKVSSLTNKLPISHWWNFAAVIMLGFLILIPKVNHYFVMNPEQWIIPGTVGAVMILFWILNIAFVYKRNVVYSEDSSVNLSMNRMEKRTWSIIWLSTNYLILLSMLYLIIRIIKNNWLYEIDYWVYILLQVLCAFVILYGIIYIHRSRKNLLSVDSAALLVDDDEFWKNGWYNNPEDKKLFVQDRLCSTNYSLNMAKPAAKIISGLTVVFTIVMIAGSFALIIGLDNAKISVRVDDDQVNIDAMMYDTVIDIDEIQSVQIIQKMPDDDFKRTNGGATEKYLIGHFTGRKTGKCMLYLYRDCAPILKIKLAEKTIYINSKDKDEVQEWYQILTE